MTDAQIRALRVGDPVIYLRRREERPPEWEWLAQREPATVEAVATVSLCAVRVRFPPSSVYVTGLVQGGQLDHPTAQELLEMEWPPVRSTAPLP